MSRISPAIVQRLTGSLGRTVYKNLIHERLPDDAGR